MKKYKSKLHSIPFRSFLLLTSLFIITSSILVSAATRTWDGSEGTSWDNEENWVEGKVPSNKDNVVIPTGSPAYPIIETGNIAIKSLTIESGGSLTFNGGDLDIEKKLENSGTFNQSGGTVQGKDLEIISDGVLNLTGGDLLVDRNLKIEGGTFNQDGGSVTTNNLEVKGGSTYNQITGEINISNDFKVSTGNTFNSTGGTVHFTGTAGNGADYTGNIQFHDVVIDPIANPKFDNDNNVYINVSGDYDNNNSSLRVTKTTFDFNGTSAQSIESASSYGKSTFGNLVISNPTQVVLDSRLEVEIDYSDFDPPHLDLNGFEFLVAGIPVPVELTSFEATTVNDGVMLNWATATEVNNYGFEIERSNSDIWEKIGFVEGHGNSYSPKEYSFYDDSPLPGNSKYRLKQIDTDGQYAYSPEVEVISTISKKIELYQNHPNPFNPSTTISFAIPEVSLVRLTIYNAIGEKIEELVNEQYEAGYYSLNFDASYLSSGFYFYRLETPAYTKTRKMVLIK